MGKEGTGVASTVIASANAPSFAWAYKGLALIASSFEIGILLEPLGVPMESWANILILEELRPEIFAVCP